MQACYSACQAALREKVAYRVNYQPALYEPFLKHAPIVTCPVPTLLWGGFYSHATETVASRLSRCTREAYRSKQAIDARLAQLIVAHTVRRPRSVTGSITEFSVLVNCSNPNEQVRQSGH